MKNSLWYLLLFVPFMGLFASCSKDDEAASTEAAWATQNAAWFALAVDSARTKIAEAKAEWGDDWQAHCQWRMYKSLHKTPDMRGTVMDSICVHILERGTGTISPRSTDSVRVHFKGWLIPSANGTRTSFTQTYYGDFNPEVAAPQLMSVSSTVAGFSTALQYMHVGDNWLVYIPYTAAYGTVGNGAIPGYSTLTFHLNLAAIYKPGSGIPDWK